MKSIKGYILIAALLSTLGVTRGQEYKNDLTTDRENRLVITFSGKNDLGNDALKNIAPFMESDSIISVYCEYRDSDDKKYPSFDITTSLLKRQYSKTHPPQLSLISKSLTLSLSKT